MKFVRTGSAIWRGNFQHGKGEISAESGALSGLPYGVAARFGNQPGSNPEELIGAAHAACFSMALAKALEEAGFEAKRLEASSSINLDELDGGFAITEARLRLQAEIPGIDRETFDQLAATVKVQCPVSKVLNADISLDAELIS